MIYIRSHFSPFDEWIILNVITKDPQVQIRKKDMLDKYFKLSLHHQSKIEFDTVIQKVIFKEIINIMGITLVVEVIETRLKLSRIKHLENRFF